MKGGTRILAYEITVILGSIPFIAFLTSRARILGLSKKGAFLIAFLLSGDVMLFPWALRSGWTIWWILSIFILIISGMLSPKAHKARTKNKALASNINVCVENHSSEELVSQNQVTKVETVKTEAVDVVKVIEVVEAIDVVKAVDTVPVNLEEYPRSIDKLIDLGFEEKCSENFEQAAVYFFQALSLDPTPDLAFYLIIDCYWIWNNMEKRDYALTQLQGFVQKYLPQLNTQLRHQFDAWMTKEDLHRIFE